MCSTGVIVSLLVCCSSSTPQSAYADASRGKDGDSSNGKRVYKDYSVIGIPGDGRCLFRSVAHGFCLRSGKVAPSEKVQRELADELRARVADEFINRRQETEWFVEGDFDTYVKQIRKPHVWEVNLNSLWLHTSSSNFLSSFFHVHVFASYKHS
ncbi:unnamed protein product [Eruca vesicaria subsp. sativa]|uniref:Ubiquitin thioesterase OTU n=1 Tax=Eruca vesicaria subsp. sativa TaxID=29727 RepID=A0ABC8LVD8_ERUVS|nr:unnamed protein product [Eruca vesicaria subsp. sativa]